MKDGVDSLQYGSEEIPRPDCARRVCFLRALYRRPQDFNFSELSTATKEFSSLLGSDGSIFSGSLILEGNEIANDIAVKRLSKSATGVAQFSAVVKRVGQMHHRNLERLLGWCNEKGELLLVYDYMPNGSLSEHLHKTSPKKPGRFRDKKDEETLVPWSRRLKILCGVATALAYLHEGWEQRVIHRDVKPANIMLDDDFNAHLGNFELALLCKHDQVQSSSEALGGTHPYMDPHYIRTSKATEKSDVYSFGITLLEVATGKNPTGMDISDWVWNLHYRGHILDATDPTLHDAYDFEEMIAVLEMGLLCCDPEPSRRPDMTDVINMWKGSIPSLLPKRDVLPGLPKFPNGRPPALIHHLAPVRETMESRQRDGPVSPAPGRTPGYPSGREK